MGNLGILGNVDEPLLNAAINQIVASGKMLPPVPSVIERDFTDSKSINPLQSEMFIEHK
jgi:urocanate hydratase